MLRYIQLAATLLASFFGVFALFDVVALPATTPVPQAGMPVILPLSQVWLVVIASALALFPFAAIVSALRSRAMAQRGDLGRLDGWRRITWALSIAETSGCLLLAFATSLYFIPSATALLIAGVAEFASILQDVEQRSWYSSAHRATI